MVYKISHSIHSVKPRAVGILILQDEIQISFCDFPEVFIAKYLGGTGQQEGAISGGVNDSSFIERSIGATASRFGSAKVLDIGRGVPRYRVENLLEFIGFIGSWALSCLLANAFGVERWTLNFLLFKKLVHLKKRLVHIRRRCDQRRFPLNRAPVPNPVEWITPAIFLKLGAARFFSSVRK